MDILPRQAADAIVNHLDAAAKISRGQFRPAVIIRVVVGNRTKPLFTGHTHTQNFAQAFRALVSFPVVELTQPWEVASRYLAAEMAQRGGISTMLVEFKDLL